MITYINIYHQYVHLQVVIYVNNDLNLWLYKMKIILSFELDNQLIWDRYA